MDDHDRRRPRADPGGRARTAEAPGSGALASVEHVLGRHLERFARRAALSVTWRPAA